MESRMQGNKEKKVRFTLIQGGKEPPGKPVIALRADHTPDRRKQPLTPKEIEELRVLANLDPD